MHLACSLFFFVALSQSDAYQWFDASPTSAASYLVVMPSMEPATKIQLSDDSHVQYRLSSELNENHWLRMPNGT